MQLSPSVQVTNDNEIDVLLIKNQYATARLSLFGAHVLSFVPKTDERERLWLSPLAEKNGQRSVRGGIPICWPWFSDRHGHSSAQLPSHGFVRTQSWKLLTCEDTPCGTHLCLTPHTTEGHGFNGAASLLLRVFIGESLKVELATTNTGTTAFTYTCALHTYFKVDDVRQVHIEGLEGTYEDKTRDWQKFVTPSDYTIFEETDRVHFCQPETIVLSQQSGHTLIHSLGHDSVVVWNPWKANTRTITDMPDDSYLNMLCIETAITQDHVLLPGETHVLIQEIA